MVLRRPSRREFMAGLAVTATGLTAGRARLVFAATPADPLVLEARPGATQLLTPQEPETAIWGYQGNAPGPLIRARQGGEVAVKLVNRLEVPTTIHWHGIRIDNAMDGVAHLTQEPVAPGESFDYRFTVPDAGTFWYHPHVHGSGPQLDRGLSGLLIVDEASPPDIDQDVVLQFDDWRIDEDGQIDTESFGNLHDAAHAGRLGNVLTVNGKDFERVDANPGDRLRLRIVSTCNARILELGFGDLDPWIVALDGQPVTPHRLGEEPLVIGPAQRVDLIADVAGEPGGRFAISEVSGEPFEAAEIALDAAEPRPVRNYPPESLLPNPVAVPDAMPDRTIDLVMAGGAMRFLESADYRGETVDGRTLAMDHGMVWALNGVAGMPEESLFTARAGEPVALRLVNDTMFPHAMHLHGHHFVIYDDANAALSGLRDTVTVEPRATTTIGLVADNPGKWMLHCHMLEHQASGMETWFEVLI